ncbi:MAG: glycoside hydrolase family 3 N-terminal domain-containing protein [Bacteroidota bacterium]
MQLRFLTPLLLVSITIPMACRTGTIPSGIPDGRGGPLSPARFAVAESSWDAPGAIDSIIASMSLEEKAGQMVMVLAYGHYMSLDSDTFRRLARLVVDRRIGGVIMAQGDVYEAAVLANRLQRLARIPLLMGADYERGISMRVRRGTSFPDAMAVGATRQSEYAYRMGRVIAEEARAIGVHQNYAPVADINTNPVNPVINTRAFGDDPALVRAMVAAFTRGTVEGRCIATAKHFPGHGDTGSDSHLELPIVDLPRERLDSIELSPFRTALQNGARSVMMSHLAVPAYDSLRFPASLSHGMIEGLLRETMGFKGLVVTDAMGMQAITRHFRPDEAALLAVKAGIDALLVPPDEDGAIETIIRAVRSGEISERRLDASVRRILETKRWLGIDRERFVDIEAIDTTVATRAHRALAKQICRDAVTLIRNTGGLVPLAPNGKGRVAGILVGDTDDNRSEINRPGPAFTTEQYGQYFMQQLRRRSGNVEAIRLMPSSTAPEIDAALDAARRADVVLVGMFVKVRTSSGRIGLPDELQRFFDLLRDIRTPQVACLFGTPYVATGLPSARAILCTYGDSEGQVESAVEALFGEIPVRGKLPVSIDSTMPFGTGIELPQTQLRRDDPAVAGFIPAALDHVGEIVEQAIADSAFPGAQVAIVRNGLLVYNRSFGAQTYDADARSVDNGTMYDLASLTKVVATTVAVMKLYDQERFSLDDPVGKFLPAFAHGGKSGITIRQLLTHRGGLPPFRQLWKLASDSAAALDSAFSSPLVARPGDSTVYSDIGMMAMGKVVETLTGMRLDEYVKREFYEPLRMSHTTFLPDPSLWERIAPTEVDTLWRRRLIQGTVHDENAAFLGGVSGHAGLFSTASELAVFMQMLLNRGVYGGRRYISEGTVYEFIGRRDPGQERWLGWDLRSPEGSSAGTLFSRSSFGHTGFTGTSLWADPERNLAVVFLTNRVYPTRANSRLFRVRPALHDAVIRALMQTPERE